MNLGILLRENHEGLIKLGTREIQGQAERARHLYLTGAIDWKSYMVTKNQA